VAAVEMEPLGEATDCVWMLALLFRLEPNPRLFKREVMTSTRMRKVVEKEKLEGVGLVALGALRLEGRRECEGYGRFRCCWVNCQARGLEKERTQHRPGECRKLYCYQVWIPDLELAVPLLGTKGTS